MTWFAWRQFRTQTWITIGFLAALGVVLVVTGRSVADAYEAANVAACQGDCATAIESFLTRLRDTAGSTVYDLATPVMYLFPALIGMFWGAPLLARELEAGTHRLAWNQSVTRTRWLATKLALIGGAAAVTVGVLSWAISTWASKIDQAVGDRITMIPERGIVPIGYALFAFALGVTLGMLIGRTVPAMGATLAVYGVVVVSMEEWIRARLVAADHASNPLDTGSLDQLLIDQSGTMTVTGSANLPDAWVLTNQTVTDAGQVFTGPADPQYCGPDAAMQTCDSWVGSLGLRQELTYHPASHFWPIQWVETGILLAAAALLVGVCFWWTRRRLT